MSSNSDFIFLALDERRWAFPPRSFVAFEVCASGIALLRTQLSRQWPQSSEPQQVVGSANHIGVKLHTAQTARHCATQAAIGFHPAEDLFDTLALALAHGIAGVAGCSAVDGAACRAAGGVRE